MTTPSTTAATAAATTRSTTAATTEAVFYWNQRQECMPRAQIEQHQVQTLRKQLAYVHERSPFYRRKLDTAGIRPDDVRSIEDVRRIPFTDK